MIPNVLLSAFAHHTRWLALVLLSLLAGTLLLAQPVWWLRLSDAAVNLAPVLLMAVILLRLGDVLLESDSDDALTNGLRSYQLATRWALVFALLVPLQLLGFAWLWADSDSQLSRQIREGESRIAELRGRILATGSESELRTLLAAANPGPLPPLKAGSLADQKQQLSEAIAINTSRLSSGLRDQRAAMLRSTLRVFFGAGIVSAFLFMLRRKI